MKKKALVFIGTTLFATASIAGSVSVSPPQVIVIPPSFVPTPPSTPVPTPAPAPAHSVGSGGQKFVPSAPDLSQILPSNGAPAPAVDGQVTNIPPVLTQVTPQGVSTFQVTSLTPGQAQIAFDAITNILDNGTPLPSVLQTALETQQADLAHALSK